MNRWHLAAILASIIIPSSALLVAAHGRRSDHVVQRSAALGDVIVDSPSEPHGLVRNPVTLHEAVRSQGSLTAASKIITTPVLVGRGESLRVGRLEGVELDAARLAKLRLITVEGDPEELAKRRGAVGLGVDLAAQLGLSRGDELEILTLAPGPSALGSRQRSLPVVALLRAGLEHFDSAVVLTRLEESARLLGVEERSSGVQAWLWSRPSSLAWLGTQQHFDESQRRLASALGEERRLRRRGSSERPTVDDIAALAMARSTLLLVLVLGLLALPLVGFERRGTYAEQLRRFAPIAGGALAIALSAGVATALLDGGGLHWVPAARTDLGRLFLAAAIGLLASPLLAGRLARGTAAAALCAVIALASIESSGATLVAAGTQRSATKLIRAANTTVELAKSGPLRAAAQRGAEVASIELIGLDPDEPTTTKLLHHLCGGAAEGEAAPIELRPAGSERPRAWHQSEEEAVEELLDGLAKTGDATKMIQQRPAARSDAGDAATPTIILGRGLARRLGADHGELVTIAAAPVGLDPSEGRDPPWPVTFRVGGIATLGLTSLDERLAIADTWQVEALGGRQRDAQSGTPTGASWQLTDLDTLAERAVAPFVARARRAAIASALQISLVAFFLGALIARGPLQRPRWFVICVWSIIGSIAGAILGFNQGASGLIEIGDPRWYELIPRGQAALFDTLSPWSLLPTAVAALAALLGAYVGAHRFFDPLERRKLDSARPGPSGPAL
jgi:ABC-type lipoprotein release transport system permease subunit